MNPLKGRLLIADPSILNDNSFKKSIVLLTEYTQNNTVGFMLNKPLLVTINDLLPEINCDFEVYDGGPVEQGNLYFVHRIPNLLKDSIEISKGVYWGGDFEVLKELLNNKLIDQSEIRFFLGYSGWSKHQLENEIKGKSWFVLENDSKNILLENQDTLWKEKMIKKGGDFKLWANAPNDISLN